MQEVLERSLVPVLEDRIGKAGDDTLAQEKAILEMRVVDPACGSGAFLIGATNLIAQRLVDVRLEQLTRTGGKMHDDTPQNLLYEAKRDVLSCCIYGVDLNPMAVELCKVALWINATAKGKPLSFLEHHIRHGNSLIGAPANFYQLGITPKAFEGRGDEDKTTLAVVKKIITPKKLEAWREDHAQDLFPFELKLPDLNRVPDDTLERVKAKSLKARERETAEERCKLELIADYWTAAFFYPVQGDAKLIPTHNGLVQLVSQAPRMDLMQLENQVSPQTRAQIEVLKSRYKFFHWWLEFPEIFFDVEGSGKLRDDGGFDVVVGNPPWERVKLEELKFFALEPKIVNSPTTASRKRLIEKLQLQIPTMIRSRTSAGIRCRTPTSARVRAYPRTVTVLGAASDA